MIKFILLEFLSDFLLYIYNSDFRFSGSLRIDCGALGRPLIGIKIDFQDLFDFWSVLRLKFKHGLNDLNMMLMKLFGEIYRLFHLGQHFLF